MIPTAPQIGFDRFIQLDWVAAALKVRAGMASLDELNELLDAAGLGVAARKNSSARWPSWWGDCPLCKVTALRQKFTGA
jgi:hypothetical protein